MKETSCAPRSKADTVPFIQAGAGKNHEVAKVRELTETPLRDRIKVAAVDPSEV